eukprot:3786058-Rhodomonas_salina.1
MQLTFPSGVPFPISDAVSLPPSSALSSPKCVFSAPFSANLTCRSPSSACSPSGSPLLSEACNRSSWLICDEVRRRRRGCSSSAASGFGGGGTARSPTLILVRLSLPRVEVPLTGSGTPLLLILRTVSCPQPAASGSGTGERRLHKGRRAHHSSEGQL